MLSDFAQRKNNTKSEMTQCRCSFHSLKHGKHIIETINHPVQLTSRLSVHRVVSPVFLLSVHCVVSVVFLPENKHCIKQHCQVILYEENTCLYV